MVRPACELYRTLEQATRQVLRREYESGIMTYLYAVPILPTNWCHVDNVETRF
jgi:2-iminoacetate synthase ThiH